MRKRSNHLPLPRCGRENPWAPAAPDGSPQALAYATAAFMLVAGAIVEWRRTVAWGTAALTAYFGLIVVVLMNGKVLLAPYDE